MPQELGKGVLRILRDETCLPIVTKVIGPHHVELVVQYADPDRRPRCATERALVAADPRLLKHSVGPAISPAISVAVSCPYRGPCQIVEDQPGSRPVPGDPRYAWAMSSQ